MRNFVNDPEDGTGFPFHELFELRKFSRREPRLLCDLIKIDDRTAVEFQICGAVSVFSQRPQEHRFVLFEVRMKLRALVEQCELESKFFARRDNSAVHIQIKLAMLAPPIHEKRIDARTHREFHVPFGRRLVGAVIKSDERSHRAVKRRFAVALFLLRDRIARRCRICPMQPGFL